MEMRGEEKRGEEAEGGKERWWGILCVTAVTTTVRQ